MEQVQLLISIIVLLIIVGIIAGHNLYETFSPLGFASNCPENKIPDSSNLRVEGCGPGCWVLKKNKESFRNSCTTDRITQIPDELPIGHFSTMGSPLLGQATCTNGVNGVQRLGNKNPYGDLFKKNVNQFTQSYAACEFGSNNIFDKDQLQY